MKFLVVIMLALGFSFDSLTAETFILVRTDLNPGSKISLWSLEKARAAPQLLLEAQIPSFFAIESFEIFPGDALRPALVMGISVESKGRVWRLDQEGLTFPSQLKPANRVRQLDARTAILADRFSDELLALDIDSNEKKVFRPAGWMGEAPVIDLNISSDQQLSAA